ncbi:efflux RND transporter periplasmic adaptor subunit [Paenibacillus planticolens]|uniref:Efflux RND transporter periplasmic adaptor subunit n=1 Tax=Paenibacillus planticolens TaxID=2654976 RepID=A0ABX1ZQ09_9BACL|nr:efflux RND transporter periplasmic adaptor subunit [Paenibacillus planticolens]NOV02170.1 efflux RND transporter periplasmic adaptor subunit [Paenibacillus planticolens]
MEGTMAVPDDEQVKKRGIKRVIISFVIAMAALTFFSNTLLNISLPEVTVEQSHAGSLSHEVSGYGTVEAAETADLYVETTWSVLEVNVKAGDTVKAGQVLVTLKTRDAEDTLKDNQARYEQKKISLEKQQDAYAEAFQVDDEKQLRNLSRDMETAKLDLQILKRQIDNLQRQLAEYSQVIAPVDGIVMELNAVKNASVPSGKAAVRIADFSKGQLLKATIPTEKSSYVKVGDETDILFAALSNARMKAKVADIRDVTPAASSSGAPQSSSDRKEVTFALRNDRLTGGEKGEFNIVQKTAPFRSLLPNDAIREDDKGKYALIVKEKKGPLGNEYVLQRASLQAGDADDEMTSIENGISPLDQVVVSSSKPVSEGDRVLKSK